jgi:hypothetical protein
MKNNPENAGELRQWLAEVLRELADDGHVCMVNGTNGKPLAPDDIDDNCLRGGNIRLAILAPGDLEHLTHMRKVVKNYNQGALTVPETLWLLKAAWNKLESLEVNWMSSFYDQLAKMLEHLPPETPTVTESQTPQWDRASIDAVVTEIEHLLDKPVTSLPMA